MHTGPPQRLWDLSSWLLRNAGMPAYRLVVERLGGPQARTTYAILAGLDEYGPISQAELGRRLGIDRSDMVAALNDLERDGLAKRAPDRRDGRRNSVTLTAAGARTLHRLDALVAEAQEELLAPLASDERDQLNALLQRLVAHHAGRGASFPSFAKRFGHAGS